MSRIDLTNHYQTIIYGACRPVMDFKDKTKHKTDAQGSLVYEVSGMAIPSPLFGEEQELEPDFSVQIGAAENPCKGFKPGMQVVFDKLYLECGNYNGKYWTRRASGIAKA